MGSLHKHIDASCLPTKLGGTLEWPEYDGKVLVEFVEHYQWYFDGRFFVNYRRFRNLFNLFFRNEFVWIQRSSKVDG